MDLHKASSRGDLEQVAQLIDEGADINAVSEEWTPLLLTIVYGRLEVARYLIRKGCLLEEKGACGWTPLLAAAYHRRWDHVELLLASGADIGVSDAKGWNLLHRATYWNNLDVVKIALKSGTLDINSKTKVGKTALMFAVKHDHRDVVNFLLTSGADIGFNDAMGWNILHHATYRNNLDVVKIALESGTLDINSKTEVGSETALMLAVKHDHRHVAKFLLASGADIGVSDAKGRNLMHRATYWNNLDLVKIALESGTLDINSKTKVGKTALMLAVKNDHRDVANFLLTSGADIGVTDATGWNILHHATYCNNLDVVKIALENGTLDINSKTEVGETALMLAVKNDHMDVVNVLLASGADIAACDECNRNALFYAAIYNRLAIAQVLLQRGELDLDAKQALHGSTAMIMAAEYGYWVPESGHAMCELLLSSGVDVNAKNDRNETALYWVILGKNISLFRSFLNRGAYLETYGYQEIYNNEEMRKQVLGDAKLCTVFILNKYNEDWLPFIYGKLRSSGRLPRIESLKIYPFQKQAGDIEKYVSEEIRSRGFCRVLDARPPALKWLCVRYLVGYFSSLERPVPS